MPDAGNAPRTGGKLGTADGPDDPTDGADDFDGLEDPTDRKFNDNGVPCFPNPAGLGMLLLILYL